jgi:hypothetical protein
MAIENTSLRYPVYDFSDRIFHWKPSFCFA